MSSGLVKYKRLLNMDLPSKQSAFLWGARKTGKSTYLATTFPRSLRYDLLKSELYLRYSKQPQLFREEVLALPTTTLQHPIIVDEVQKIPLLLNEIHWLIENSDAYFIMCGSSARKLKKEAANLLGGRAWRYTFYPLVSAEIPDFDLLTALNNGLIPSHYLATNAKKSLKAYILDYLTQEIQAEGMVRSLPSFSRFLDAAAFSNGELINFTNIARDCGIDAKTVKSHFEILEDTLLGYFLPPYTKKVNRELISSTPKFYLFDVGVANALTHKRLQTLKGAEAGKALEHFIFMELIAFRGIYDLDFQIHYWRTKTGLEVDFVLGSAEIAIEVKVSNKVRTQDLKGLIAFASEHHTKNNYVVSMDPKARKIILDNGLAISVLPYKEFLSLLWQQQIIAC